jgi:hypothetical protein
MKRTKIAWFYFCEMALKKHPELSDIDLCKSFCTMDELYLEILKESNE